MHTLEPYFLALARSFSLSSVHSFCLLIFILFFFVVVEKTHILFIFCYKFTKVEKKVDNVSYQNDWYKFIFCLNWDKKSCLCVCITLNYLLKRKADKLSLNITMLNTTTIHRNKNIENAKYNITSYQWITNERKRKKMIVSAVARLFGWDDGIGAYITVYACLCLLVLCPKRVERTFYQIIYENLSIKMHVRSS